MKLLVVAVGKMKRPLADVVAEYERRAERYWRLEVIEVAAGASRGKGEPAEVRAGEADRIRSRLPDQGQLWVLTRKGKGISSPALARALSRAAVESVPGVTFVLGGAFGIDAGLIRDADLRLSLSELTLPHDLARLVLAEQLYRAGTILRNEPYHKGGG